MAREPMVPSMTVDAHVNAETALGHTVYDATSRTNRPWVVVDVGDYRGGVNLYFRDLDVLTTFANAVDRARQALAEALGLLPTGEPCEFADAFGTWDWNEHDHDRCLEQLLDEPVPFVPVVVAGTEWEGHTDPTVEDNPLDDDDFGDESDDDDDFDMADRPGSRILRAEGWL